MTRPQLVGALPELQRADARLTALAGQQGITYTVADFGGVRSLSDTTRILEYRDTDYRAYVDALRARNPLAVPQAKERWRPISAFGLSFHNYGAAFDVTVTGYPVALGAAGALAVLQRLAPAAGLVSGVTFPTRRDPPHMQLPITLAEARRRFLALGGVAGVPLSPATVGAGIILVAGALFALARAAGRS